MRRVLVGCVIAILASSLAHGQSAARTRTTVLIRGVSIVDVVGGLLKTNMTIVVRGDRIVQVTSSAGTSSSPNAEIVDAPGTFAIPGLWDMHVHTFFVGRRDWSAAGRDVILPLFIANGVTGVRDMGSDLDRVLRARQEVGQGTLLGPHMVVAGPMLDGPGTAYRSVIQVSPSDARTAVDTLKQRGVDFIKVQSRLSRDAYLAIADESRRKGLTFVGHVPDAVLTTDAITAGQRSFEHLIGIFEGSSTLEDDFVRGHAKSLAAFLDTFDSQKEAALIRRLAAARTWQCPTLFWERVGYLADQPNIMSDADARYVPSLWSDTYWPSIAADIVKSAEPFAVRERFIEHELGVVKRLHDAGIPFLAGTDTPSGIDLIPGFSLHHELERFVAAGFTPLEALQTATINPARFLGRLNDFGTVEPGRIADLVLLTADPTKDIRNTRKIWAVVAAGQYLSRADLDHVLSRVEVAAQK